MKRIASNAPWKARRSGRFIPLLLAVLLGSCLLGSAGCPSPSQPYETSPAITTLEPSVSADLQKQVEQEITQFLSAVQQKDYEQVRHLMSPALRARTPSTLAKWLQEGPYNALDGANKVQCPSAEHTAHGKKLVVHTRFTGANGTDYRTNIIFVQAENTWRIDKILPPTKPSGPFAPVSGAMKSL